MIEQTVIAEQLPDKYKLDSNKYRNVVKEFDKFPEDCVCVCVCLFFFFFFFFFFLVYILSIRRRMVISLGLCKII
jgi:hypothetical protein